MKKIIEKYLDKIDAILDNNDLEKNGDNTEICDKLKIWLLLEWQCNDIEDMEDYDYLRYQVEEIVKAKVQSL